MKKLFEGAKKFSENEFNKNKTLYKELSNKQSPHTLFIGCSDSRVVPNLITSSFPGDLFIVRNIANIVPYYRVSSEFLSTTSAIEYAVNVLEVDNIIICGHSDCGGCKALYIEDGKLDTIPHTKKWLELARPVKEKVEEMKNDLDNHSFNRLVEQENVILQIKNLLSYPYIKQKYQYGTLGIYGWYYDIENGIIYNYDKEKGVFEKIR